MACLVSRLYRSWIGSFQLFMQYAPGILVGRAFDAGYLYFFPLLVSWSCRDSSSCQPLHDSPWVYFTSAIHAYALVNTPEPLLPGRSEYNLSSGRLWALSLGIFGTGSRNWPRTISAFSAFLDYYWPPFQTSEGIGHRDCCLRKFNQSSLAGHNYIINTFYYYQGASVGGIVWPILLIEISRRTSFINGIRATAALAGAMLVFSNCFMRTQPQQKSPSHKPNFHVIFQDSAYLISIASYVRRSLFYPVILIRCKGLFVSILDSSSHVIISSSLRLVKLNLRF